MKKSRQPRIDEREMIAVLRAQAQSWLQWPNITSVGVGYRLKSGVRTSDLAIQVTVAQKLEPGALKTKQLRALPRQVRAADGRLIPIDVVERKFAPSFQLVPHPVVPSAPPVMTPRVRRRRCLVRVLPGISVGHLDASPGTLGAIVYDNRTGRACALSNAHVLESPTGGTNDVVLQPGRADDNDIANTVLGRLVRSHRGLAGDCAIATIETRLFDERILELDVAPRRLARAGLGDTVTKSSRTTGVTHGIVVRVGVTIRFDYGGVIGFREIGGFEIGPDPARPSSQGRLCDGGDSGALWMIRQNGAVTDIAAGVHFAAQVDAATGVDHALACNIDSVFEKLNVSFTSVF